MAGRRDTALAATLGLILLGVAGCSANPDPASPPTVPCAPGEQQALDSAPMLGAHPADAESVDRYRACDEGSSFAGRFYQTSMDPDDVVSFYRDEFSRSGWKMLSLSSPPNKHPQDYGEDLFCASAKIGDAFAYLELWYPDDDSDLLDGRPAGSVYVLELSRRPRMEGRCRGA